jgi:hypothetical protein
VIRSLFSLVKKIHFIFWKFGVVGASVKRSERLGLKIFVVFKDLLDVVLVSTRRTIDLNLGCK